MKFEIYREQSSTHSRRTHITTHAPAGDWRWRMKAKNGRVVAESGEGYRSLPTMVKSMKHYVARDLDTFPALRKALSLIGRDVNGRVAK